MSERVLVTGGLGFVGSSVVQHLAGAGFDVAVFDDRSRGSTERLDGASASLIHGDIRDLESVRACITGQTYDAVVHLAAMHFIPDCNRDPQGCIVTNVVGTENVLAACLEANIGRVIAASSMAVYPIRDEACAEDDPIGPYDVYGETKATNEMQLQRWCRASGATGIAVRLSNAYGPRETNPHVIPEIFEQVAAGARVLALGNTAPQRDYIHVDDIARALEALLRAPLEPSFDVYNLGSGEERSVDEILAELGAILGYELTSRADPDRFRPVERMHLLPAIDKITAATGWHPTTGFSDGLRELCHWYGLTPAA